MTRYEGWETIDALPDESLVAVAYHLNGEAIGFDDCDDFNAWWCDVARGDDDWVVIEGIDTCPYVECPQ